MQNWQQGEKVISHYTVSSSVITGQSEDIGGLKRGFLWCEQKTARAITLDMCNYSHPMEKSTFVRLFYLYLYISKSVS